MIRSSTLACHVETMTGARILDDLGRCYDDLARELQVPLTSGRTWLSQWATSFPQMQPWAITAWNEAELVGCCLFARRSVGNTISIVALGQGRNDRTRLLARDSDVAAALAERFVAELALIDPPWTLRMEQLAPDDTVAGAIAMRLPGVDLVPGGSVPGIVFPTERSLDANLSKNLRRQLHKCRNRMASDGVHAAIAFTRDPDQLLALLDQIEVVHRARDHDVGRTSDIDEAAGRQLWRGLIAEHVAEHKVEVATLHIDATLAAYVVSFLDGDIYRVFDGRFLTSLERYSPGRILETETFAHAMHDGRFVSLDWMNSIAPDKLICANTAEPTVHMVGSSSADRN